MNRLKSMMAWLFGLIVLVFLIQFPINQNQETWQSWALPLAGKTIVIDPGHGGPDGGAVGSDGTHEKDIALNVSTYLADYLRQAGAFVHMTREEDRDLASEGTKGLSNRKSEDIRNRLKFIHDQEADFFVSIHLNAIPSPQWFGAQTFYYPEYEESTELAHLIQDEIIRNLENTTRAALAIHTMYLLKYAEVPGALVEIGFLSNEQEREQLKQESYQEQMAASIYQGIIRYVTEDEEADQ